VTDMNIRDEIVRRRREDISKKGYDMGCSPPDTRRVPLVPFNRTPFLICEIKRSSPSRGDIARGRDPVAQAAAYVERGVKTVSVLTESNYFSGSLCDLMRVKNAYPELAVLRKDFLLEREDIIISHRAGADVVLLIASILTAKKLRELYTAAHELGLAVLVEVHDAADMDKTRTLAPEFTGINARDLSTFKVDLVSPLLTAREITWETELVFESGIHSGEDALFALSSGFDGILVGEAVMREPGLIPEILAAYSRYSRGAVDFWRRLFALKRPGRPLVKICGITNQEDARLACELGADLLGFVFASSPRRADASLVRGLAGLDLPKVGVVVCGPDAVPEREVAVLLEDGCLQAVQFHGTEKPDACFGGAFPYYKALRLRQPGDAEGIRDYRCPRVLVDAHAEEVCGGTGRTLDAGLILAAEAQKPLWLAGGLGPQNIREIIDRYRPELVDASSRLEAAPGKKDPGLLKDYFKEIDRAQVL
jgi:indole-3-glycerol phosphate synthase/phosphoribosylanthranilate isomerase